MGSILESFVLTILDPCTLTINLFFSIVLLAVVDANNKFMVVDLGVHMEKGAILEFSSNPIWEI